MLNRYHGFLISRPLVTVVAFGGKNNANMWAISVRINPFVQVERSNFDVL